MADGPASWEVVCAGVREEGKRINLVEMKRKAKAQRVVKAGGHHIVDEIVLRVVQPRRVDQRLVDELEEQGLLDDVDSDAEADLVSLEDDEDVWCAHSVILFLKRCLTWSCDRRNAHHWSCHGQAEHATRRAFTHVSGHMVLCIV